MACPCGHRWTIHTGRPVHVLCKACRKALKDAPAVPPVLRQPTLQEWRQLATDHEVRAGRAAWARGIRNKLTVAMAAEHTARSL